MGPYVQIALLSLALAIALKLIAYGVAYGTGTLRLSWRMTTPVSEVTEAAFTAVCLFGVSAAAFAAGDGRGAELLSYLTLAVFLSAIAVYPFAIRPWFLLRSRSVARDHETEAAHAALLAGTHVYHTDGIRANAYATGGVGSSGVILLSDDLRTGMTPEALSGLLAHELGHLRLGHLPKLYGATLLAMACGLSLNAAFEADLTVLLPHIHYRAGVCGGLFYGVPMVLIPGLLQRRLERQADQYAALVTSPRAVAAMLYRLDELSGGAVTRGGLPYPKLAARLASIGAVGSDGDVSDGFTMPRVGLSPKP